MGKTKEILTSWRVILLILFIIGALFAISPRFGDRGVIINSVDVESSAAKNDLEKGLIISEKLIHFFITKLRANYHNLDEK